MVNQARDMSPYPRGRAGDMDRIFFLNGISSSLHVYTHFEKINSNN
jgi:hypothetical protein